MQHHRRVGRAAVVRVGTNGPYVIRSNGSHPVQAAIVGTGVWAGYDAPGLPVPVLRQGATGAADPFLIADRPYVVSSNSGDRREDEVIAEAFRRARHDGPIATVPMQSEGGMAAWCVANRPYVVGGDGAYGKQLVDPNAVRARYNAPIEPIPMEGERLRNAVPRCLVKSHRPYVVAGNGVYPV